MDPFLLASLTILGIGMVIVLGFIVKLKRDESASADRVAALMAGATAAERGGNPNRGAQLPARGGRRLRAGAGLRRRGGGRGRADESGDEAEDWGDGGGGPANPWGEESGEEGEEVDGSQFGLEGKVGKKKLAKLQAKEEKRAARAAELAEREERKEREKLDEARREATAAKEAAAEAAEEERRKEEAAEKARQEQEAYEAMKSQFAVEEEGFDEAASLDNPNLLNDFIAQIKREKSVGMEDLASTFHLKTAEVVERIKRMVEDGTLTGVIDDRGKFIYIAPDELEAVAKWLNQRGRVSLPQLADYSNKLIRLESAS